MGKLGKIIGILVALVILIFIGLTLAVKFYITDERVKNILVPQVEEALGRKVSIGKIHVGLFSGIAIDDFAVKETDNQTDFLSTQAFVLNYDLFALLQKEVVISELRIDQPVIRVIRDKKGVFNYSNLAILAKAPKADKQNTPSKSKALPIALTVQQIAVKNAKFILQDAKKELPDVDASADLKVALSLGNDLQSLSYKGKLVLDGNAIYGEVKPNLSGSINFDQNNLDLDLDLIIDQEKLHLSGQAADFMASPNISIDITSDELNLDKLLGIAALLPAENSSKKQGKSTAKTKQKPIAQALPNGLVANGKVAIQKAIYKGVDINAFILRYNLEKGILSVNELGAMALGGSVISNLKINLNEIDPDFSGSLGLSSIKAAQLQSAFAKKVANVISGSLDSSIQFSGKGTEWDTMKNTLTADGDFALSHGSIPETPTTVAISNILGIRELRSLSYKDISGKFNITKGGKVNLNSSLSAPHIGIQTDGQVGLDGSLNLPLTVKLDKTLSSKMDGAGAVSQFLADEEGNTVVNLKLGGTTDNPRPTLDSKSIQQQLVPSLIDKLTNQQGKTSGGSKGGGKSPLNNLMNNFFK